MPTDVNPRPRLLVVESDAKHLRTLTRTLKAIVGSVDARETLDGLPGEDEFELVVANYDVLADDTRKALLERFGGKKTKTNLLFFSEGKCKEDFVDLFGGHYLTNLVAKNNAEVDPEELIVTTRKIVNRDIFGLEKYFIWGVEPRSMKITKSTEKAAIVNAAEEYAKNLGVNARFVSHFCSVADEFVTNAVYNAPRDADGKHRFAHVSRTEEVSLSAGETVEVKFCCDGRRLGISTADPFGSLHLERLLDYLAKCLRKGTDQVDEKEGGAGLGFYYIFDSLSHFVVNIAPGKRTEMIGIIDIRGTYKDFSARHKSFNVFTAPSD